MEGIAVRPFRGDIQGAPSVPMPDTEGDSGAFPSSAGLVSPNRWNKSRRQSIQTPRAVRLGRRTPLHGQNARHRSEVADTRRGIASPGVIPSSVGGSPEREAVGVGDGRSRVRVGTPDRASADVGERARPSGAIPDPWTPPDPSASPSRCHRAPQGRGIGVRRGVGTPLGADNGEGAARHHETGRGLRAVRTSVGSVGVCPPRLGWRMDGRGMTPRPFGFAPRCRLAGCLASVGGRAVGWNSRRTGRFCRSTGRFWGCMKKAKHVVWLMFGFFFNVKQTVSKCPRVEMKNAFRPLFIGGKRTF